MSRCEEAVFPALSPHFSLRAGLLTIPLAVAVLLGTTANVSANQTKDWGVNGSGVCSVTGQYELGSECIQSVTGWIQINETFFQDQAISCSNNSTASGLAWSVDSQPYVNAGPWYALVSKPSDNSGSTPSGEYVAWQTGNGGDAFLDSIIWDYNPNYGSIPNQTYGSANATVNNVGGDGYWQAATGCINQAGADAGFADPQSTTQSVPAVKSVAKKFNDIRDQYPDETIDSVDLALGKAFLAREYTLEKRVRRTDIRTCPTGMIRKGKLAYTIQEFTANHQAPQWIDRARVRVNATGLNKRSAKVAMKLITGENRTVVQFQMHCVNRPSGKPI